MQVASTYDAHDLAQLAVEVQQGERGREDVAVVACRGEIDVATAPALRDRLAGIEDADVLVDLTEVAFLDSTGLSSLLNALRRLTRAGRRLAVACPPGPVRETLRLTDLVETLGVADDRAGALARLAR